MSEQTNYCTTKGLGWAFAVCVFIIVGVPVLINLLLWPEIGVWTMM